MPIIIDITEAGGLVPHWRPYRKEEDVQRVYEGTLSAGCSQLAQSDLGNRDHNNHIFLFHFQPNFQRPEIQQLWNLEVIELQLFLLWKERSSRTMARYMARQKRGGRARLWLDWECST